MWEIENILLPKHYTAGLRLMESEDILQLEKNGHAVAHFSHNVTKDGILRTADQYIEHTEVKHDC